MHPADFEKVFYQTIEAIRTLSGVKGGEYASEGDRLSNFKEAARRTGMTPEQVWLVYLDKHYAALSNFIRDLSQGKSRPRSEPIEGRAQDMMVYLILFIALLAERHNLSAALENDTRGLDWEEEQ